MDQNSQESSSHSERWVPSALIHRLTEANQGLQEQRGVQACLVPEPVLETEP